MLPTPAKTPRKRPLQTEESLNATARVLFPGRPATIDEAVPTPRKMRKTKNLFTLESFEQEANNESSEKIQIYTDSKERVPTNDDDEDNPFVTKKGKGRAKATPQKSKKVDARTAQMEAAANRDEGMVYIFRGRKIFRKFQDDARSHVSETSEEIQEDLSADEMQLRRQVGHDARRPLTRSSIKPRKLFQAEIKERNLANGITEDDEEAETEIEAPAATPSRRKGKAAVPLIALPEATPPPTARKVKRGMSPHSTPKSTLTHPSAEISFDSWSRVKSAHSSGGSVRETKKRGGEPLEREADKRARSEHSTSSMSIDNI
jgi:hypothetical protein